MKTTIRCLLTGLTLVASGAAAAAETEALRVCASTKDAPYSNAALTGFENVLAGVLAEEMQMPLELVKIDNDAIYLVRDGIEKGLCDVLMGVDSGDSRLLTSQPYYRSGYAFISREEAGFDGEKWQDLDREGIKTVAYRYHSPAETIMKYTGRYEYNMIYQASLTNFEDRRNKYTQVPADRVVSEVAAGTADLAIIFAPEAARYVRDSRVPLKMTLITNEIERSDGRIIPLQYDQSVGVVSSKPGLLEKVDEALTRAKDRIEAVLKEEGIPTLPPGGNRSL